MGSYYLIYREGKRGGELSFNIGGVGKEAALIKVTGRRTEELFNGVIRILGETGCITPIQTGNPKIYEVRDDVGPVIGTYLVLVKRARRIDYWMGFLEELLTGELSVLGEAFSTLLQVMMSLSRRAPPSREYTLSPKVVSSFSSALKTLVRSLKK